jgi:hypothetical protein
MIVQLPPVLLTSSVVVMDHSVALKSAADRVSFTLESVDKWLDIHPDLRLVICDGSGYDFRGHVTSKHPGREVECLNFVNDKGLIKQYGKGYGEGEIIKHALSRSAYLQDSAWFAKCTGKLWVDNFLHCLSEWNNLFMCKAFFSNVFSLKRTRFEYVDTRFYMANKDAYLKYFSNAHLNVGGERGASIEDRFKEVVLQNGLKHILFASPPAISGVGGEAGKYYNNSAIRQAKEKLRSRLVSMNPLFRDLYHV